jgi:hypothetical protein
MIQFRALTAEDWAAFSGCESDQPKIAELNRDPFFGVSYVVIVDGLKVEVTKLEDGEPLEVWSTYDFSTEEVTLQVAEGIVNYYQHAWDIEDAGPCGEPERWEALVKAALPIISLM